MIKFTANYSYSNHNFVIQNLAEERIDDEYLPAICILKNILQRGRPTLLSKFLQQALSSVHKEDGFKKPYVVIDREPPRWKRIIKGDAKANYFPAKKFFEDSILKHLSEYKFIQQLLVPEVPINEITQVEVDEFKARQVDFYLPQAYLIIEIDGSQHDADSDKSRDIHTAKYEIKTVRIKTGDLEAENETFLQKIDEIKKRIRRAISHQVRRQEKDPTIISLQDYKSAFENGVDLTNANYMATAVMRFQLLVLELLERGTLSFSKHWKFELLSRDINGFAELAVRDLHTWFEPLFKLHKLAWEKPDLTIIPVDTVEEFSNAADSIKVDFSLLKRYTDEFQDHPSVVFVRTDYFDEYRYFKTTDAGRLAFACFEPYDYYRVSTTKPVRYRLKFGGDDSDEKPLLFFLENVFLQDVSNLTFNEGQLPIIANALSRNDTIGLLPTGSGKSVCYQLSAILQPAVSFVVCPTKSLMYDQKADLDLAYFSRVNHITSDDDGEDKEKIQNEFGGGKYLFIFISPERFQIKTFRQYFSSVNKVFNIAYAVIDEVHCLSEWGHDFRTAYLNLSSTIHKLCSNFNFIGLTATASINVLEDIKVEFGIKRENVKTPVDYTRKELDFVVVNDNLNKQDQLIKLLDELNQTELILKPQGNESKCGIIFTPFVNGALGCHQLASTLSEHYDKKVEYYSGSIPKNGRTPVMRQKDFDEYKKWVQDSFKRNEFTLLTATKAFGMGVNKLNIHFTVHYGIPGSMEALYQEGGRAGRDREKFREKQAKCYVLLSPSEMPQTVINKLWIRETTLSELREVKIDGDLKPNLFLFTEGLFEIDDELNSIKQLYEHYAVPNRKKTSVRVMGEQINLKKAKAEKIIYRLNQLGVIKDWTITNFFGGGVFDVDFTDFDDDTVQYSLLKTINKYDKDFSFDNIRTETRYSVYNNILNGNNGYSDFDKYVRMLLQWSYDNFAYNRRQSLKNIYENCCEFSTGNITNEEFKTRLENYFKFNESSYILQHIAENPRDYHKWFEVFYQIENNNVTTLFLARRHQEALRDNLSRFLESYMYNTGLDLISGLLRLLLDDYENVDGRGRLEGSLEEIKHMQEEDIDFIISQVLKIGKSMTSKNKNYLAETIYNSFRNESLLYRIQRELEDSFSMLVIIEKANKRLPAIKERLDARFRKA